jgi:hypothetical protein
MPGVNGKLGRPFVGVMVAYLNRSSPNHDLAKEFLDYGESFLMGSEVARIRAARAFGPVWAGAVTHH